MNSSIDRNSWLKFQSTWQWVCNLCKHKKTYIEKKSTLNPRAGLNAKHFQPCSSWSSLVPTLPVNFSNKKIEGITILFVQSLQLQTADNEHGEKQRLDQYRNLRLCEWIDGGLNRWVPGQRQRWIAAPARGWRLSQLHTKMKQTFLCGISGVGVATL